MIRSCLFALAVLHLFVSVALAADDAPEPVAIEQVLALGPLPVDAELMEKAGQAEGLRRALVGQVGEGPLPRAGQAVDAFGHSAEWQLSAPAELAPARQLQLWWFQFETERFVRGHLQVEGVRNAVVFVDGKQVDDGDEGHALDLRNGSHDVWIVHEGAGRG